MFTLLLVLAMHVLSLADGPAAAARSATSPDTTETVPLSFRVREWTIDDGLPTPVAAVAQSADGYLWITTREGLVRFDGVRFTRFTAENVPLFRDHDFVGVYAATSGDLWVGGKDGWTYRLRDGAWTAYPFDADGHWVQSFAQDGDGTLWAASTGPFVLRFRDGAWERLEQEVTSSWPFFSAAPDGSMWASLDPADVPGASEARFGKGVAARWNGVRFVPPADPSRRDFVASAAGPLFHRLRDEPDGGPPRLEITDASGRRLAWLPNPAGDALVRLVDRDGRAWVQSEAEEGLDLAVVENGQELARIHLEDATWFEQVFEDRQGNVWVHSRGIGLVQITEEPFLRLGGADGVPQLAWGVTLSPDGAVVVSPDGGVHPESATVRGRSVTTDTYRLRNARAGVQSGAAVEVGQVLDDARGQRWGIRGPDLFRLEDGQAEIMRAMGDERLRVVRTDPADADVLWVGDEGGIVRRFDTRALAVTDSFQVRGIVRELHTTPDGRLWVGTDQGLIVRMPDGALHRVADDLLGAHVVHEFADGPDRALWIATDSGLARIRDGETRVLGTRHGLPTTELSTVLFDDVGFVWLSGVRSLYRLRLADAEAVLDGGRDRLDIVTILPSAGHLGSTPRLHGAVRTPDGGLWVPSYKGVTRVDPAMYARQYARPPTVIVEQVATERDGVFALAEGLRLPLGARMLTIAYTATDFLAPGNVRFRTRLDGHDADWVEQGGERNVVYGGLAPGRYTFNVQAMNAAGVWSELVAAPAFVVPHRFFETVWFVLLVVLGVAGLVVLADRARVRDLRDRQNVLEATVATRTADLAAEKEVVLAQAEDLMALDQAKSLLFANVSHEFRTPLTLAIGPLRDMLDGRHGEVGGLRPHLDGVLLNNRRLLRMVNQLLDAARLESHTMARAPREVDLAAFAREMARTYAPLAERKRIRLTTQVPDQPLEMTADPDHLDKILSNLLSNAFKFTPPGGRVGLAVWGEDNAVVVRVTDSGAGIPPDDLPHIFERFYRADKAHSTAGSGIGLSLVEQLVSLHGGAVDAESTEGGGATFTVRLSRAGALVPEPLARPALSSLEQITGDLEGDGGRMSIVFDEAAADTTLGEEEDRTAVLVVDDNADVRAYVRSQLEASYRVREAADGVEALLMARVELPDLIVSDVMMPEMDGFALLAALRRDPDLAVVPVVLLTARAEHADKLHGLERGADDYLVKPFASDELRARVDGLIRSRQRLRAHYQDGGAPDPAVHDSPTGDALDAGGGPEVRVPEDVFLTRALEIARAHLSDPDFGVQVWADALGADRSHLYRRVRKADGVTPVALLRQLRIERAIEMLDAGAGSVSEVAYGVGFNSLSHFSRVFKAQTGHTPSDFASTTSQL